MKPARIWITGAGGLIGHQLARLAPQRFPGAEVIPLGRGDLDLADFAAVDRRLDREKPGLVIHCAGLTRSPECQADPARARRLNVEVTAHLADRLADSCLVFFSTDLVFDGTKGAYVESDPVNPLSAYAETKAEAERAVLSHPRHRVIRTSLNYGRSPTGDRAFNEEMLRAVRGGTRLRLFTDEFRSPIAAEVTARAVCELFGGVAGPFGAGDVGSVRASGGGDETLVGAEQEPERATAAAPGSGDRLPAHARIFHVAGAERLSRWEIGEWLARFEPAFRGHLEPASLREYRGAPRPPDTSLDCRKAQALLRFALPRFSEWLAAHPPSAA